MQVCPRFLDEQEQVLVAHGTGHDISRNGHFLRSFLAIEATYVSQTSRRVQILGFSRVSFPLLGSSRLAVLDAYWYPSGVSSSYIRNEGNWLAELDKQVALSCEIGLWR